MISDIMTLNRQSGDDNMCTSLTINADNNHLMFGRTMDFPTKTPWQLTYLPTQYHFRSVTGGQVFTSRHVILGGMRQTHGHYLIGDGINDAGLTVAELYFPVEATYYDAPVAGKINLSPQDFTTWLLAQHASVAEITAELSQVALIGVQWYDLEAIYPFHWVLADKTGSYLIEPTGQQLTVRKNPVGVLTNTPNFDRQIANLNQFLNLNDANWGGATQTKVKQFNGEIPNRTIPTDRFIKTSIWKYRDAPTNLSQRDIIQFLHTVKIDKHNDRHDYTHYYGVIDTATQEYWFQGVNDPTTTKVSIKDLAGEPTRTFAKE